jgi:hypothetical protein
VRGAIHLRGSGLTLIAATVDKDFWQKWKASKGSRPEWSERRSASGMKVA